MSNSEGLGKPNTVERKPISVLDINSIEVSVLLNGVETKGSFKSAMEAYEKMRVWHKQIVKGREDNYRVNYAVVLGVKKNDPYVEKGMASVSGMDWKDVVTTADYIATHRELDFSNWIEWIANQIRSNGKLKSFQSNSSAYIEVHVSWNVWRGYFHSRRRRKGLLVDHNHSIMDTSWNTRALLVVYLLGFEWPFVYRNTYGESHYYHGTLVSIHQELSRLATAAYEISNVQSTISQVEALEALNQFYRKFPDFQKLLTDNYYLMEEITRLAAPQYDETLRKNAFPILTLIPPKETIAMIEKIYISLSQQLSEWKHILDSNKEYINADEKASKDIDKDKVESVEDDKKDDSGNKK